MKPRAGEEDENFSFVLKRCRSAKYAGTQDLDMRHAQRYSTHTLHITKVYKACSTSLDVGQAIAQNRG